jgi:FixJ family two-component response regulator
MPELDGWQVLEQLKSADDTALVATPVLMLTALGGPMDRVRGGIEGAVRYLTKPIDLDELRGAVLDALAEPEPPQRRNAQRRALEMLARIESNSPPSLVDAQPRLRLSALERDRTPPKAERPASLRAALERLDHLTVKQRALLEAVASAPTVLEAATALGVSRSNIYASLRRISRKLGTSSVPELLAFVRSGQLLG